MDQPRSYVGFNEPLRLHLAENKAIFCISHSDIVYLLCHFEVACAERNLFWGNMLTENTDYLFKDQACFVNIYYGDHLLL